MQIGPGHGHFENAGCDCICLAGVERNVFDLPACIAGVMAVHVVEIAGEQGRFVAAFTGADFDDELREIVAGIDEELVFDLGVENVAPRPSNIIPVR